ncbi:cytochrome c [Sulfuricurvum sp.]|uniref:c-type cytochrome n=1 Tax=Sulfuricurvum sp. TaxID=2025608 RepID=UPI002E30CB82|nr:cytochrome c [Sulfuricurvum sp.]HEX5329190.1 cytochrome c [Sulfuricurvum sp.]
MKKLAVGLFFVATSMFAVELGQNFAFKNGEQAFQKVCFHCHSLKTAPHTIYTKMDDAEGVKLRAEGIFQTVRHGSNAMPAFRKSEIDDAVLRDLATKLANGTITDPSVK